MRVMVSFFLVLTLLFSCGNASVRAENESLKVAFVRQGHLFVKEGPTEVQVSGDGGRAEQPQWSHDGQWLSYVLVTDRGNEEDREIWVYHMPTKQRYIAAHKGTDSRHAQWAPDKNMLAYQMGTTLQMREFDKGLMKEASDVAPGVGNYAWLPSGDGFLVSSQAQSLPDGWTQPILFKVALAGEFGSRKVERLFTVPGTLKKDRTEIWSVLTSAFKFSADGRWVAFLVSPTASWSMDSNMLCVLSSDGRTFAAVDEMLADESWFQWAPKANRLGYIEGGGRLVLSSDKELKVKELPALMHPKLTPEQFAERDLAWLTDDVIVVSRVRQEPWKTDPKLRALPTLVKVDLKENKQAKLVIPPKGYGDFSPVYLRKQGRIAWVRSSVERADIWIANADGTDAHRVVENIGFGGAESVKFLPYGGEDLVSWYQ